MLRCLYGLLLCSCAGVAADVELRLQVDDVEGADWHVRGVVAGLVSTDAGHASVNLNVAELRLPDGRGALREVQLSCALTLQDGETWRCQDGRVLVAASPWASQQASWTGSWTRAGGASLEITGLELAAGKVTVNLRTDQEGWRMSVSANRLNVARLDQLDPSLRAPPGWTGKGYLSGRVEIAGRAAKPGSLQADLAIDRLTYTSPDDSQAGEDIVLKLDADARASADGWRFDASVRWPRGAVYSDPLFLDAAPAPPRLTLQGRFDPARDLIDLAQCSLDLPGVVQVSATGVFALPDLGVTKLTVAAHTDHAGRLYERVLQAFLIGTPADDMSVAGQVGIVVHYDGKGVEQAGMELNRLALADNKGRFSVQRVDGSVAWDRSATVPASRVTVAGASVYRIPSGEFSVSARFAGERIDLIEPLVVPVLGGQVALDSFSLHGALMAGEQPRWEASASVREVSLAQLTQTLEWPPFNGTVSGRLRDMRYADQVLRVGGGLELNAFAGDIAVSDLTIREPFGYVPTLGAEATMRGLDLEALTETFSFGRIEGLLDADVSGLELVAWQPNRFDLHLYTPAEDRSRHRISQRAVRDLTELGSGVPAGLSATVLGIFDEFRYDRIDLTVRLRGDVAELDGLARPDGGYYLVKGSGLPRIDVIGRNRSVAWKDLVERLRQIRVEGAQIR